MKWALATVNVILLALLCVFFFRVEEEKRGTFSGMSVVFLCVGSEHDSDMTDWRRGFANAERDLGCTIEVWNCDWSDSDILEDFARAIKIKPDVICVPGYESEAGYQELMEEALSKGIHVSVYHTPLPELQAKYRADGVGFVGQDEYADGRKMAVRAVQKFGLDENSEVLVMGNSRPNADLRLRSEGIMGGLREHGINYTLMDMSDYWHGKPFKNVNQALSEYLASHPKPECILFDSGGFDNLLRAFDELGIGPGDISVGSFNTTQIGLSAIKQNFVQLAFGCGKRQMGYLAVLHGCMSAKYGTYGMDVVMPGMFFETSNIESYEKLFEPED